MTNLPKIRKQLIILLVVLGSIDLAAIVILLSPMGRSREEDIHNLQLQLKAKSLQVQPLRGLDKKVVEAKEEIAGFYKQRLPSQYSAISAEVGKLANANGIKIAQAKFHPEETDLGALRPVTIDALLAGDYVHLMKFINAIERDPLLFIVDSIQLGDAQGGNVKLQLKMQTYLQSGA